ncbi:MAG: hypothetical protein M3Y54_02205 [Bacteroidota bacterium]|nr:hypothetical protein [Bacteroidota bacterium]
MNKLLIGFCIFVLLAYTSMGFAFSWVSGLTRLALAVIAMLLLSRLLQKDLEWQMKTLIALGLTGLVMILSTGAEFMSL